MVSFRLRRRWRRPLRQWFGAVSLVAGVAAAGALVNAVGGAAPVPLRSTVAAASTGVDDATAYMVSPEHSGSVTGDSLTAPLARIWTLNSVGINGPLSYPIIASNHVYFTTPESGATLYARLEALDRSTGQVSWIAELTGADSAHTAQLTYDSSTGELFAVSHDGNYARYDPNTGVQIWSHKLPAGTVDAPPTASGGTLYIAASTTTATLYAIPEGIGIPVKWTATAAQGDGTQSSPTVSSTGVSVSYACAQSYDFDPTTGTQVWHHTASCAGTGGITGVLEDTSLWVATGTNSTSLPILDSSTGASKGTFSALLPPAFDGTRGYFVDNAANPVLQGRDPATGTVQWTFNGDHQFDTIPVAANGVVYVASSAGTLYGVDANTGTSLWTDSISPIPQANVLNNHTALAVGEGILVVPDGSTLIAYASKNCPLGGTTTPCVPPTPSVSPTAPSTPVVSGVSPSVPASPTVSVPASPTVSVPASPTVSVPASPTVSIPASPTVSIPASPSVSPSVPATPIVSATASVSSPPTPTPIVSATASVNLSPTPHGSGSPSGTEATGTPTILPTTTATPTPTPNGPGCGYWMVASDGGIFSFGCAQFHGSTGGQQLPSSIVGMAALQNDRGYWLVEANGTVFPFGDAPFEGSAGGRSRDPVVAIAATPSGRGYWLVSAAGIVLAFGDARQFGDLSSVTLSQPIVGMAATPDGQGYWLVASDGGIFSFGNAQFHGSTGNIRLNKPIVGMASTFDGNGYWLVATDGGIFAFGNAQFYGSTGNIRLNKPVVGMASTATGHGYWMVATDGGIFSFGDADFHGSTGNMRLQKPVNGMALAR